MNNLTMRIKEKREEMIALGMKNGFTAKETLKCSQELDEILNEYNQKNKQKIKYKIK